MNKSPSFVNLKFIILVLSLVSLVFTSAGADGFIPVTDGWRDRAENVTVQRSQLPSLGTFIAQVQNGNAEQVTGLYSPDRLALPVVQQPESLPGYVSTTAGAATQFGMATQFDSLGFLAHNYLAGVEFFEIAQDDMIYVIYGDGHYERYRVIQIRRLQALQPGSVLSDFVDLGTKKKLTATELFYETYGIGGQLVLQTCIAVGKQDSWGRLFVIATPFVLPEVDYSQLLARWHP